MTYLSLVRNTALSVVSAEHRYVHQILQNNCGLLASSSTPSSVDSTVNVPPAPEPVAL